MTNYRRGRDKEFLAVRELRQQGYVAFRSAGSHSPVDVTAINKKHVRLIQIKRTKSNSPITKAERQAITALQVPKNTIKELWLWKDRHGWNKTIIQ